MTGSKKWYLSRTLWGGVIIAVSSLLCYFGFTESVVLNSSGSIFSYVRNTSNTQWASTDVSFNVCDGSWHCFIATVDWTNLVMKAYIDGESTGESITLTGTKLGFTSSPMRIGRNPLTDNWHFDGSIDEVIIENRAWSASEIKKILHSGKGSLSFIINKNMNILQFLSGKKGAIASVIMTIVAYLAVKGIKQ